MNTTIHPSASYEYMQDNTGTRYLVYCPKGVTGNIDEMQYPDLKVQPFGALFYRGRSDDFRLMVKAASHITYALRNGHLRTLIDVPDMENPKINGKAEVLLNPDGTLNRFSRI